LRQRLTDLGYQIDDAKFQQVFEEFKRLADRKKVIYDADIEILAESQMHTGIKQLWTLEAFTCNAGTGTLPHAAVALWNRDGTIVRDAAVGDGPIDAVFKTIERMTGIEPRLIDYRVRNVSAGEDAQGEATVEVEHEGRKLHGRGVSTDIIEASALAFLEVINRIALRQVQPRLKPTDHVPQDMVPAG
jgi:2-isopropylmalate synthase